MRQFLHWTRHLLLLGGISLLAWCVYIVVDARAFQQVERRQFDRLLTVSHPIAAGGPLGRIDIPRLGLEAIVMEGTSAKTLRRAVGHIEGTALPGQAGNVGLSGHRDTFFRPLRNIRRDDLITVATLAGNYRYSVLSVRVVPPEDVAVLEASETEILTLVTCYPFYFVGPAPKRFVVRAARLRDASESGAADPNRR